MTTNDPLAASLSKIDNAAKVNKTAATIYGVSKMLKSVLSVLQTEEYLSEVTYEENTRGGKASVSISNTLNRCGAIKPRFKVKVAEFEKFEQRYLPAKGFGLLILSTSKGIMTNAQAKEKNVGGRLLAYCY